MKPSPPQWALSAGLPEPLANELFMTYVKRLGLDPAPLLAGLSEQTLECANLRLRTLLQREMAHEYRAYVDALSLAHIEPSRLLLLKATAHAYSAL